MICSVFVPVKGPETRPVILDEALIKNELGRNRRPIIAGGRIEFGFLGIELLSYWGLINF
jgi:hypothetical protein